VVDEEKCTECGECIEACPYEGIFLQGGAAAMKCDLCEGDPVCVKVCYPMALEYRNLSRDEKSARTGQRVSEIQESGKTRNE
jgi:Fe-S-cluster-containing hydrogenase component 2